MWAWQVYEDGEWNIIGAVISDLGLQPLVTSRQTTYEMMRPLAQLHHDASGFPVRGVRYDEPNWSETL